MYTSPDYTPGARWGVREMGGSERERGGGGGGGGSDEVMSEWAHCHKALTSRQ